MKPRLYSNGTGTYRVRTRNGSGRLVPREFPFRQGDKQDQARAKAEAEDFKASMALTRAHGAVLPPDSTTTVNDLIAEWSAWAARELAEATRPIHALQLRKHVVPRIGTVRLNRLTPGRIADLQDGLATAGVGAATISRTISVLSGVFRWGVERDRLPSNPCRDIRKVRAARKKDVHALEAEQCEAIIAKLPTDKDAALVRILTYAGMRPSEALALRWADVGGKSIRVSKAVSDGAEKETKNRRNRSVTIVPELRSALDEYRESIIHAGGAPFPTALLFARKDGTPWRATDFRNWRKRVFYKAAEEAGLSELNSAKVTPYTLRHSFVTRLIAEKGAGAIAQIAGEAGHSQTVSLDIYSHHFTEAGAS